MIDTIVAYFHNPYVQKGLVSFAFFVLFVLAIISTRRFISRLKIDEGKRHQSKKWSAYLFLIIYLIVLVRIWANADLFVYLKSPVVSKLLRSGFAFGIVYLALYFVRRFINSLKIPIEKQHEYRKKATYVTTLLYIIILIPIWAGSSPQWATILSVMGAGVALALHEVLLNMAGWVYIIFRRPYKAGDRIELGGIKGDVIDIQLFQTTLLEIGNWVDGDQSTGRVVNLPHGQIFRNSLYNYTKGFEFIWNEISIVITFESNWEKARGVLLEYGEEASREIQQKVQNKIKRMAREYLIYYNRLTPIVYTRIIDSGIKITLRYLTDVKQRRIFEDELNRKILKAIDAAKDINFAYTTFRITQNGDGK